MKRSQRLIFPTLLQWLMPLLLIVPNVAISIMAQMETWAAVANVILPLGIYLLIMSATRKAGPAALWLLPIAVLAAFQIVLLYLYSDGSIIAVDMFLNVVTTNGTEASELLMNLADAIVVVLILYLPPLVLGIVLWVKRMHISGRSQMRGFSVGAALSASGMVCVIAAGIADPIYEVEYDVFPVNAVCNLAEAVVRTEKTAHYAETSADFSYGGRAAREPHGREIYFAVIGETSRADHYQLLGYDRFTTPLLARRDSSLIAFDRVMSESNTTHKAVPMLLSTLRSESFDSIYYYKSVISAFRDAGFHTAFVSMQARNGSFIDFFGEEADTTIFLRDAGGCEFDLDLLPAVDSLLAHDGHERLLVVLHMYGSHFNYIDRYPRQEAYFLPDKTAEATAANRDCLINAYDNSIRHTDRVLDCLMHRLDSISCCGGLIYASDHGEDIFDDERGRFLHASPTATFVQLHVPMLLYFNDTYRRENEDKWHAAVAACHCQISSSESFPNTLLDMAGVLTDRSRPESAVTSGKYREPEERLFLNDRNEAVSLRRAGFRRQDFAQLERY